jgi:hypothetical protein
MLLYRNIFNNSGYVERLVIIINRKNDSYVELNIRRKRAFIEQSLNIKILYKLMNHIIR